MHSQNLAYLLDRASSYRGDKFVEAMVAAKEAGIIVPSILKAGLQAAGFVIEVTPLKTLTQVKVYTGTSEVANPQNQDYSAIVNGYKGTDIPDTSAGYVPIVEELVAMGASSDEGDALLHAALGYIRELDGFAVKAIENAPA